MKKFLMIGVSLVLLTAGKAFAIQPENSGLKAEIDARIDADAALQFQIDALHSNQDEGGVQVYDNSDQYLGSLMYIMPGSIRVYDPTLKKVINIITNTGDIDNSSIYYIEGGCIGQAYAAYSYQYFIFKNFETYFTGDMTTTPSEITYKSYRDRKTGVCKRSHMFKKLKFVLV